jgi:hypothetical protein
MLYKTFVFTTKDCSLIVSRSKRSTIQSKGAIGALRPLSTLVNPCTVCVKTALQYQQQCWCYTTACCSSKTYSTHSASSSSVYRAAATNSLATNSLTRQHALLRMHGVKTQGQMHFCRCSTTLITIPFCTRQLLFAACALLLIVVR